MRHRDRSNSHWSAGGSRKCNRSSSCSAATAALREKIDAASTVGSVRLLSARHEFTTEWARFSAATVDGPNPLAPLTLTLREEHYPVWARQVADFALHTVELFASAGAQALTVYDPPEGESPGEAHRSPLNEDPTVGGLRAGLLAEPLPAAVGAFTLHLDDNSISDLWVALTWGA